MAVNLLDLLKDMDGLAPADMPAEIAPQVAALLARWKAVPAAQQQAFQASFDAAEVERARANVERIRLLLAAERGLA